MQDYDDHEPEHASSPTAHLLEELSLYGYRPFSDEADPRPLPDDRVAAGADCHCREERCAGDDAGGSVGQRAPLGGFPERPIPQSRANTIDRAGQVTEMGQAMSYYDAPSGKVAEVKPLDMETFVKLARQTLLRRAFLGQREKKRLEFALGEHFRRLADNAGDLVINRAVVVRRRRHAAQHELF